MVCVLFYRIVMGLWDDLFSFSGYLNLLLFKDSELQTMSNCLPSEILAALVLSKGQISVA